MWCLNYSLCNKSLKGWFFKTNTSTSDTTNPHTQICLAGGQELQSKFLMTMLKTHRSQRLWKAVASGERPHKVSEERRGSMEGAPAPGSPTPPQQLGEPFCGAQMPLQEAIIIISGMAGQGSVILSASTGPWLLAALWMLFYPAWLFIWGLCSSCASRWQSGSSAVFAFQQCSGVKKEKGIFVRREEREVEQLFMEQLRFPCPNPTYFLQCLKASLIKWISVQLVSG